MDRVKFEELVSAAIDDLPDEFVTKLENVDVLVQDWPTADQLRRAGLKHGYMLLGLYEGVPRTERGQHYGLVPPDKITIFQRPIEGKCKQSNIEIATEIGKVVRHEIAHHFGIGDARLEQIEKERDR
ncbi:metallopeptidase family protein [Chloroflexota bacterium]